MKIVHPLLVGKKNKYRGIHGRDVARAMIAILQKDYVRTFYDSDELQMIASETN
jgi:hypothetical protein